MTRSISLTGCIFFLCFFQALNGYAQAYTQYSLQDENPSAGLDLVKVVNGEAYALRSVNISGDSAVLTKHAPNGDLLYSTNIPLAGWISFRAMDVIDGEVYLLGGKPLGIICCGRSIQATKVSANGSVIFNRVIADTTSAILYNPDGDIFPKIMITGNEWIISSWVTGQNLPTTMGVLAVDDSNIFLLKLNATTGEIVRSMGIPGLYPVPFTYYNSKVVVENGFLYTAFTSYKTDLPVTIGSSPPSPGQALSPHVYVRKINLTNFSTVFARYVSVDSLTDMGDFTVKNGEYHIAGTYINQTAFYTKLYADGSLALTKDLALSPSRMSPDCIKLSANHVYIVGPGRSLNNEYNIFALKLNFDGSVVYLKNHPTRGYWWYEDRPVELIGDDLLIAGSGAAPNYPVTNNSNYGGLSTGFITRYDQSGNMVFSSFVNPVSEMVIQNNKIYLVGTAESPVITSTDGSSINGLSDVVLTVLKTDGSIVYSGYLGGSQNEYVSDMDVDDGSVFMVGNTTSPDFPTTVPAVLQNPLYGAGFLTKISFCPDRYDTSADTLSPAVQTVCKYGLAQIISGNDLIIPGDSLPLTYANAVQTLQRPVDEIRYQWQKSFSPSGPWTNIQAANDRDYRPIIGSVDEYFRRQSFLSAECNSVLVHTSDAAAVLVSAFSAPQASFESPLITCPSSPVVLDGNTAVSGGQPPYNFSWDMGLPSVADPVASPAANTVYTLLLTDALGCQQLAQVVVLVYKANAGQDKSSCAGQPVRIGTAPLPAASNVSYDWLPAGGLNSNNIAQPMGNPLSVTDYSLTVTLAKADGSICTTHDTVSVTPVAAPADPKFAGPDKVVCNHDSILVGTLPEAGFSYSWIPNTYITGSDRAQTYYHPDPPPGQLPVPNPAILYAYAKKQGCTFSDTTTVAVIEADAGPGLCMAGILGKPDRTPAIPESYAWTLIAGPGDFLGATNLPQVPVSASISGPSFYGLTVSYIGKTCFSQAVVNDDCGYFCGIRVDPADVCAGYAANGGQVSLIATSNIPDGIYSWTPQIGLSTYTGNIVQLTDTVSRTYTLTVISALDSLLHCSASVTTNLTLQTPVFSAEDTITCANVPVTIGAAPQPGYIYEWTGNGLSDNNISDPVATVTHTSFFYVTVTNSSGCKIKDTVMVTVPNDLANAGEDRMVCDNAILTLGTDSLPNTTYSWDPAAAPWQNGTDQFSANPQVLSAVTVTYTLTKSTAGCTSTDDVTITVNNFPTIEDTPDRAICKGSGVWIGSEPLPGVTYQWSPATGLADATSSSTFANPASTTTYTLTATFPGTCTVPATDDVTVTVKDLSFSMPDIEFCPESGALQLGDGVPTGMSSYRWRPENLVSNAFIRNPTTIDPPPGSITNLILTVGNSGCFFTDTMQLIPFLERPIVSVDRTICVGQPVRIGSDANTTGAAISYQWSPANNLNDPTSPDPVFTGMSVGTYQYILTKTNSDIPCSNSDTVVITVVDILPELNSVSVCRNSCTLIGTTAANGISYAWMPEIGLTDPASSNTLACIDSNSIVYTLTANDGMGCIETGTVTLTVMDVAIVNASVANVTACVGEQGVSFAPSVPPGSYSWVWSPDNNTLSNIYVPNPVVQTATPGTQQYTVEITDNGTGCTQTIPVSATINECPTFGGAGNYVWIDLNGNGLQDVFERGARVVAVRLFNEAGYLMANSVTDLNGNYQFENVIPGNNYYIVFEAPAGYRFTIQNVGGVGATNNNKADASGRTGNFDLLPGDVINNMDAGLVAVAPVPVSLLSFNARLQNKEVILTWQTANESNCQFFYVERSTDAFTFNTIGRLDGHGTTSVPQLYQFKDLDPIEGYNFYRLKQTDFDGRFTYSNTETVRVTKGDVFTAFYNNSSNSIHVRFNATKNDVALKMFAPNGQLVAYRNINGESTGFDLPLPFLSSGIYFLQVSVDGNFQTRKIYIAR